MTTWIPKWSTILNRPSREPLIYSHMTATAAWRDEMQGAARSQGAFSLTSDTAVHPPGPVPPSMFFSLPTRRLRPNLAFASLHGLVSKSRLRPAPYASRSSRFGPQRGSWRNKSAVPYATIPTGSKSEPTESLFLIMDTTTSGRIFTSSGTCQ